MATIKIVDTLSAEVLTANPQASSGFAKYLKGPAAQLLAGTDFVGQFKRDLPLVNPGQGGFKLQWSSDVPLGTDAVSLKVGAGASALIGVYNRTGMLLVDDAFVGPPVKVPPGLAFVSFLFRPALKVGATSKQGALTFGFEGASEAGWQFFHPVSVAGENAQTLHDACKDLLETLTFPNTVDDLKAISGRKEGTMSILSGRGQLSMACAANVAAAVNPLASIDTLGKLGKVNLSGALSATVGVKATISGEFQIRVQTVADGRVRLGYHKMAAREIGVTLDASAGPGLTLGDRDVLKLLFGDSTKPGRTIEESLVAAGVTTAQLKRITTALKSGLSRKLQLEIGASFSALKQDEAAFLYEVDPAALDAAGAAAVDKALSGDLTALTLLEGSAAPGIKMLQSRTTELRKRVVKWRLNLIGLVNVLSVSELAVKATVVHDEDSGEVVMTDAATSHKVKAVVSRKELQKLLYESLMLTVTYKAAGLENAALNAAQSYFKVARDVNRHEMADYLDAVAAMGMMRAEDIDERMGLIDDFGRASLLIDVEYDQSACDRMFLDDDGAPRTRDFYEDIGKLALLALVQKDDVDAYRRIPLENATLWKGMRNSISSDFGTILPPPITSGTDEAKKLHVGIVTADYIMIVWWADAMAEAATKLAEMRAFLKTVTPSDTNKAFVERRRDLGRAMVDVIQKSPSTFGGDPWGVVALFYASRRSATVTSAVVSSRLTMFLP